MTRKQQSGEGIGQGLTEVIAPGAIMSEKRRSAGESIMAETDETRTASQILEERIAFYTAWNNAQSSVPEPKNAGGKLDAALQKASNLAIHGGFSKAVTLSDPSSKPTAPPTSPPSLTTTDARAQAAKKK